ncbi:MAG TPA: hypothetical protein VKO18_17330 [Terriglobia bacterium]|nr:hypothetical protein [Terriglobia bacterium]
MNRRAGLALRQPAVDPLPPPDRPFYLPVNGLPAVVRAMTRRWEITLEIFCRDSA